MDNSSINGDIDANLHWNEIDLAVFNGPGVSNPQFPSEASSDVMGEPTYGTAIFTSAANPNSATTPWTPNGNVTE